MRPLSSLPKSLIPPKEQPLVLRKGLDYPRILQQQQKSEAIWLYPGKIADLSTTEKELECVDVIVLCLTTARISLALLLDLYFLWSLAQSPFLGLRSRKLSP